MSKLVRTTQRPFEEITVSDDEYAVMLAFGMVFGQALPGPPDPDDLEMKAILEDETSQTYSALLAQLAAVVNAGTGTLPDALRAAFRSEVEGEDFDLDGAWEFAQAPTVGGVALGAPPADSSTAAKGIVELATTGETTTGTDTVRAVTPAGVKAVADALTTALGTMVPITKFGPVGTNDDTATFVAAAAAKVTVYVPPGTYRAKGVVVGTGTVFHMGAGVVFKRPVGSETSGSAIFILGTVSFTSTSHVTDCGLVGGPWMIDYTGCTVSHAVQVFNAKRWRVDNLSLLNSPNGPAITLAKNDGGTMPEDGAVTNIRSTGGGMGSVWLTSGRRLEFRQIATDSFCPVNVELDFGTYQNSIVEDIVMDGLSLERPATAHTVNQEAGVKFVVPSTCRVSRVSVRGVRVLNADGVQLLQRSPYGAGTIEDVTIQDVRVDCNGIGHFGVTVDQIDPTRVVIRRLHVTGALSQGAAIRGDVTLYDSGADGCTGIGFFDVGSGIVAGRVRRFYNCRATNNGGSGFYTGTAERYELYGCVATDSRGASATQNQGVNVADGGSVLIVGGRMSPNKVRRVYWNPGTAGTVVREVDSLDADTNGSVQAAAPTTGIHGKGEMVWNSNVAAGGSPGWVCVVAGEPGTWKAMANLSA